MLQFITHNAPKIALGALTLFAIISLRLAWTDALTFDEVAHIPAGYSYVTLGDYRLNPEHPPLLKALAGLPLIPLHPHFDTTQDWWTTVDANGEYGQWAAGRALLHESGNNTDWLTFAARIPMVAIAVFCGALLFVWGRRLAGALGGLLALLLYVLSPNILGHNHFVTTDIGIATAIAFAFFILFTYIKNPTWRNALLAGGALGIAQVVKFSAIVILPFFVAITFLYPLLKSYPSALARMRALVLTSSHALVGGAFAVAVVWLVYAPFTLTMPPDVIATIAPIKFHVNTLRNSIFEEATIATNTHTITRPFAMYLQGLGQVLNRVDGGNGAYFFGEVSSKAFPLYFPVVFLIKETLPHIALLLIATAHGIASILRTLRSTHHHYSTRLRHYIIAHITELSLIAFILFYAYISITGNLNIGYRHLMPIVPLLYLLVGITLARAIKHTLRTCACHRFTVAVALLFGALLLETASAYPFYTSYFNQSVGGPKNGYRYVTDSNADWGQDAKRLKTYLDEHPEISKIRVDYFGGDNIANRIGDRIIPWWDSKRPIETGWYAISVNYRQGSIYSKTKTPEDSYRFLLTEKPVDQVGTSILIYFIDTEPSPDIP